MSAIVNYQDVLVLLEDGPKPLGDLTAWLQASEIVVLNALTALRLERQVRRVEGDRWALASDQAPDFEPRLDPREGYEVAWRPHRDAPSLTGSVGGLGSTLSGQNFKVCL